MYRKWQLVRGGWPEGWHWRDRTVAFESSSWLRDPPGFSCQSEGVVMSPREPELFAGQTFILLSFSKWWQVIRQSGRYCPGRAGSSCLLRGSVSRLAETAVSRFLKLSWKQPDFLWPGIA